MEKVAQYPHHHRLLVFRWQQAIESGGLVIRSLARAPPFLYNSGARVSGGSLTYQLGNDVLAGCQATKLLAALGRWRGA